MLFSSSLLLLLLFCDPDSCRARRAVALAVANGAKDLYPEWQLLAHGLATELLRLLQIPVLLGREQKGRQRR